MKKSVKKLLLLMAVVITAMVCFAFSVGALAETGKIGDNISYNYNDQTKQLLISGSGNMWNYYNYDSPFCGSDIKEVVIENGVTSISTFAFYNCKSLEDITIPETVSYIGSFSFQGCKSLTGIVIPDAITSLDECVFDGCKSLKSLVIPDSVTYLGPGVISGCSALEYLQLSASVEVVDFMDPFAGLDSLKKLVVTPGDGTMKSSPCANNKSLEKIIIQDGVKNIVNNAFYGCSNVKCIEIPDSVTSIGEYAFYGCENIETIKMPDGITSIGDYTFYGCAKLEAIGIPKGVTTIGTSAFDACVSLAEISVEKENKYYSVDESGVLFNAKKTKIIRYPAGNESKTYSIPNNVVTIGERAFSYSCNLEEIIIGKRVTKIESYAFEECRNLKSITIPDNVTELDDCAFSKCTDLKEVTIGKNITYFGGYIFDECSSLETLNLNKTFSVQASTTIMTLPVYGSAIDSIKNVNFLEDITRIEAFAFCGMSALENISIPDTVTVIEGGAFWGCSSLRTITIPENVTEIYSYTFKDCSSLKNIIIPENATEIGDYSFAGCSDLTSIVIPCGITRIGESAFRDCTNLLSITLPFVGESLNGTENTQFSYIFGESGYVPESLKSVTITAPCKMIDEYAFYGSLDINSIVIPESVTSIGEAAFGECTGLVSLTLPFVGASQGGTSNTHFGYVFGASDYSYNDDYVPSSLKEVVITAPCKSIDSYAFYNCIGLTNITIPDSVVLIGNSAFGGCTSLTSIVLPFIGSSRNADGTYDAVFGYVFGFLVKSALSDIVIQKYSSFESNFYYIPSSLRSVTITDDNTIPFGAFWGCSFLTDITLSDNVTSIGEYAFFDCEGIASITIPDSVTSIGSDAFYNTGYYNEASNWIDGVLYVSNHLIEVSGSITDCNIREGTKTIPAGAFSGHEELVSIIIPDGITSIGASAFYNCTSLTSITISDSVVSIGKEAFYNTGYYNELSNWDNRVLYIGNHLIKAFDSITSCDIREGTKTIADNAFYHCSNLSKVTIPEGLVSIGKEAFMLCYNIKNLNVPDSVILIGNKAFYYCESLTGSIAIPYGTTSIGDYSFYCCGNLTSITIPDSVTVIGDYAFYNCLSLTNVVIPDGVTLIGDHAFSCCYNLTSITIPYSVTSIGKYAFGHCSNLISVALPVCMITLDESVFYECSKLTSITIPISLTDIKINAFYGTDLKYVFYSGTQEQKKNITIAFEGNDDILFDTVWHYKATGHKEETLKAVSPTCTKTGLTEGKKCTVCGTVTVAQKTVAKTAHTYKSATCTTPKTCKICKATTGKALGHKYTNACDTTCNTCKATRKITHSYKTTVTTKATLTKNGKTTTKCSICGSVKSTSTVYYPKTIKLYATSYVYDGKTKTPSVTVKDSKGKILKKDTDYTVKYASGRKSTGKYSVTITFKGKYSGKKTLYFTIAPAKVTLSKVTAGSKQATVAWNTTTGASGYQVMYSTSSKFKSAKTATVSGSSSKKTTIKKLTKGKKYYFKVRAYKTVNGTKLYGAWSSVKSVKVK